ncbi:hypothetical protein [Novosphingobium clariflavum]|uniref:Uncharacterized protein n=1 Tax=Novosphingobium clariflavum TaxID=2029884 RepID=A0ABV6S784_9SPHN|nr:hypothetical protein [Novosphingobium clariflavum]
MNLVQTILLVAAITFLAGFWRSMKKTKLRAVAAWSLAKLLRHRGAATLWRAYSKTPLIWCLVIEIAGAALWGYVAYACGRFAVITALATCVAFGLV